MTFIMNHANSMDDFKWEKRVIRCSQNLYVQQLKELNQNKILSEDLKLTVLPSNASDLCELIGLDGGLKDFQKQVYSIKQLERLINQMPMRKEELEKRTH